MVDANTCSRQAKNEPPRPAPAAGDYYKIAFLTHPEAMLVVDFATKIIHQANPSATQMLGMNGEEALRGQNFLQFLPDEQDWGRFAAGIPDPDEEIAARCGPATELKVRRANGYILLTEAISTICPAADGQHAVIVRLRDITAQKMAEEQYWAEQQAANDQYLVDYIGDGFLVLNQEGSVIFANSSAERLLQQPLGQILQQPLTNILPSITADLLAKAIQRAAQEGKRHQTLHVPVPLKHEMHSFEFALHPHRDGVGILFRDISDRVKQEMEIAKLNATMRASQELLRHKNNELNDSLGKLALMNEELERADKLKSEFLANTSHELRTPLNSIIGFLQLIVEGLCENEEEEDEYIRNALTSAKHLLAMINDVLDIARIEAGRLTLLIDDLSVEALYQEVYSLTRVQAQQKGLRLHFDLERAAQDSVRADFHRVKQVLINLIGNAIKFTNEGEVRIWSEPDSERGDMLRIVVEDTGIGVAPEQHQAIFEKFIQVDGTSTRKYQGTGLGLAISRNLVELMGGTIHIFSEGEGKGTRMSFTLPRGNAAGNRAENGPSDPPSGGLPLPQTF